MGYQEILSRYPPSDLVDLDDPELAEFAADGGCRVCAQGEPCQDRIDTDVADILMEAQLPQSHRARCLQWLTGRGASSLTHSITQLAQAYGETSKSGLV